MLLVIFYDLFWHFCTVCVWLCRVNASVLSQLQVCCSHDTVTTCPIDGNWTAAPVMHVGATSVQLSWHACGADTYVMGLRYLWRLTPCNYMKCAIYSVENELPAPPFIFREFFGSNDNNNSRFWHANTMKRISLGTLSRKNVDII